MPPPAKRLRSFFLPWPRARGCGKRCAVCPPRGRFNRYRWTRRHISSSKAVCRNSPNPPCPAPRRSCCLRHPRSAFPHPEGRCLCRPAARIKEADRRQQSGRGPGRRAGREPGPGRQAGSGRSQGSEKNQWPHGLRFRPPAVLLRRLDQTQSPIAVRKEAMGHLAAEREPLSRAGKRSPPGRR
jgi:hypothetical protein